MNELVLLEGSVRSVEFSFEVLDGGESRFQFVLEFVDSFSQLQIGRTRRVQLALVLDHVTSQNGKVKRKRGLTF